MGSGSGLAALLSQDPGLARQIQQMIPGASFPSPAPPPPPMPTMNAPNPGQFALGNPVMPQQSGFTPNPQALQQAGVAATPFGFGTPNPYASYFQAGAIPQGSAQGAANANAMAATMAQTPTAPPIPPNVTPPPVNIPPITFH